MYLCDDGHDEVCYDSRSCPVCSAIAERDEAQEEVTKLEKKIEELENQS